MTPVTHMEMIKGSPEYIKFRERVNAYRKKVRLERPDLHEKVKEAHRRYYRENAERLKASRPKRDYSHRWNWHLEKKYNLTKEGYQYLFDAQNGVCAICDNPEKLRRRLAVDHDHISGKIRGLLCHRCNTAIGLLEDNIKTMEAAINYLKY